MYALFLQFFFLIIILYCYFLMDIVILLLLIIIIYACLRFLHCRCGNNWSNDSNSSNNYGIFPKTILIYIRLLCNILYPILYILIFLWPYTSTQTQHTHLPLNLIIFKWYILIILFYLLYFKFYTHINTYIPIHRYW